MRPTDSRCGLGFGLSLGLALLASLAFPPERAAAQLDVRISAARDIFVAHEPVAVTLTITNRAGRDITLAGRGNAPWLTFQITDGAGNMVSPKRGKDFEPVLIPAGRTLTRTIAVNSAYSMTRLGAYRVLASIYFPQLDRYFRSNAVTVQIADGRELWQQVVGVPGERAGAGEYRRYVLLQFNTGTQRELYFRLLNERTGSVLITYSLGQLITVRQPQWTVDGENRLHVLHMGAPRTFAHTVIDANGTTVARETYREVGTGQPRLVQAGETDVIVQGGVSQGESDQAAASFDVPNLSDRPPGLPRIPSSSPSPGATP